MTRRLLLALVSRLLAAASTLAVLVPGAQFVAAPLRRKRQQKANRFRIAPLADVPVGEPVSFVLRGRKVDAWKVYPERIIGQIWVIRHDAPEAAEQTKLTVFSATCPHLGCTVDHEPQKGRFVCPCHAGVFELDGTPVPSEQLGYRNPVPRGLDPLPWKLVRDEQGELWLEVEFVRYETGRPERVPVA